MARKKAHAAHENHERWLISYADFITLLFAFFVVMFASSQVDKKKAQAVSESVATALEQGAQASAKQYIPRGLETKKGQGGSLPDPPKVQNPPGGLENSMKLLSELLKKEIQAGKVELHMEARGLVVTLHESAFFASGDDKIFPDSYSTIARIAQIIHDLRNPIRLEGHTDSIPIHTPRFDSNWELSAARSIAMLNLLSIKYSIPRERLAIAGYADTLPVASNDTPEGRARNRRVDVVILNMEAGANIKADPKSTPGGQAARS